MKWRSLPLPIYIIRQPSKYSSMIDDCIRMTAIWWLKMKAKKISSLLSINSISRSHTKFCLSYSLPRARAAAHLLNCFQFSLDSFAPSFPYSMLSISRSPLHRLFFYHSHLIAPTMTLRRLFSNDSIWASSKNNFAKNENEFQRLLKINREWESEEGK